MVSSDSDALPEEPKIEIRYDGHSRRTFERVVEDDRLIISRGDYADDRVWHLLRGNFEDTAANLRRQHPGRIEDKRTADVIVALPAEELSVGLLCACLPTEDSPGLPFHVNADFFPSNDRKHVILGNDYQSQWNRAALLAAARTVADATPQLPERLGPRGFWHLADTLRELARIAGKDGRDKVWKAFWENLHVRLLTETVVPTSSHDWTTVLGGVALLQHEDEAPNISVLEDLGVDLVTEDLRPYQNTLRSIAVPFFGIAALCSALKTNGLDRPVSLDDLPASLASETGRAELWTEIAILLGRRASNPNMKRADEERLGAVSLAPCIDEKLWPCQEAFRADASTIELFASLGIDIPFLDRAETAFGPLVELCSEFEVEDAVEALEGADPTSIQQLWTEGSFSPRRLIGWFESRNEQLEDNEEIQSRVAALSIYPGADRRLHPLTSLVLPGDFKDPLGLTRLVDVEALGRRREFLLTFGVHELDFRTLVLEHLPRALEDGLLEPKIRDETVALLAGRLGQIVGDDEIHDVISSIPLVMCTDGEYHCANDCYFPVDVVKEVLGQDATIAVVPKEREDAVRRLFDWLGVESEPRLHDIVQTVRRAAEGPCSPVAVARTRKIVAHLGQRLEDIEECSQLEVLRDIEWLPARQDKSRWYRSSSLYAPYQAYLFDSQGAILDVPPSVSRDLLVLLGVQITPSVDLVVRHLLYCAERSVPVNSEVYRFLNDNFQHPVVEKLQSKRCLWLEQAYRSPDHVFWVEHPFGQYRWRLADDLRGYGDLLEKIGVTDTPDHEDALGVLNEISAEFGESSRPLDDATYAVVMGCWQMLEEALNGEIVEEEWFGRFRETKSIPNEDDRVLYHPTRLFFENRAGLAAKFGAYLTKNVIPQQLGTTRAFLAAGVRQLGSAVGIEVLRAEGLVNDPDTVEQLRQSRREIARVLSGQMDSGDVRDALDRLNCLDCKSAIQLEHRYRLNAFDGVRPSSPEFASALYHPDRHSLWTTRLNGRVPLASLARELAIALCPDKDPGLFAAGLKEVVAADTTSVAATVLDELGFPPLDETVVESPPVQETAPQLGTTDQPESSWPQERDGSEANGTARGEAETTTEPESRGAEHESPSQGREFVSYIAVSRDDKEGSDPDDLTHQARMSLEEKAIQFIIGQEPDLSRTPTNNPGFDLAKVGPDGQPVRWVEVKAMKGTLFDREVTITRTQFEYAQKHGEAYWLYVVENAGDTERAEILRIKDPVGQARDFKFDRGWREIAQTDPVP